MDKVNKVFQLDEGDNSFLAKHIHLDLDNLSGKKLKKMWLSYTH